MAPPPDAEDARASSKHRGSAPSTGLAPPPPLGPSGLCVGVEECAAVARGFGAAWEQLEEASEDGPVMEGSCRIMEDLGGSWRIPGYVFHVGSRGVKEVRKRPVMFFLKNPWGSLRIAEDRWGSWGLGEHRRYVFHVSFRGSRSVKEVRKRPVMFFKNPWGSLRIVEDCWGWEKNWPESEMIHRDPSEMFEKVKRVLKNRSKIPQESIDFLKDPSEIFVKA